MTARKRHLAKTITWRIIATTTTFVITWIVTGSIELGAAVGGIEGVTKLFLYYGHERLWYRTRFGLEEAKSIGR